MKRILQERKLCQYFPKLLPKCRKFQKVPQIFEATGNHQLI